jgi:trigger factor
MESTTMQVSVTTTKGLERRLEVAVPGERVAGEVDQRLKRLARTARLKGFRPGKVPYAVVRAQFGSQVHAETVNDLMQSTFAEAVREQRLRPAAGPRIEPITVAPGSELRYAAVFEVLPEVSLKPLGGIEIVRPLASVTDEDVEAMLETMRAQRMVYTTVARPAREGDRVSIDFEGRIDGVVFPGGSGQGLQVVIGAHRILPELEQALPEMAVGDVRRVAARFPDDYGAASVAGKQAEFELKLVGVEESSLPPIDEAFARGFGIQDGNLAELRTEVRASMERELADATRNRVREQLFDALYRENPLEVPQGMVEQQIAELQAQAMRRQGVQDPAQAPPRSSLEAGARKRVAIGLLIGEVVRGQSLKLDRARVEQRLDAAVLQYPDPQEARRQFLASRETMGQIESAALEDQAIDWVLGQARVSEQPTTFRALTGFGQQP